MSRLEKLIQRLCPDGVEYRPFGEMAMIVRGASPRPIKNFITTRADGVNWIKIGDVKPDSKYITETAEKITPDGAKKSRSVRVGDFILSNSMSFGRPYIMKTEGCIHDGWLAISNFNCFFIADFLYHLLNSNQYQSLLKQKASFGGAVQNLNADIVRGLMMPVVPLEVQQEIVRILDSFTQLTAELTAELTARQKQYEYYMNSLLYLSAPYYSLEDVCDIVDYRGKTPAKVEHGIFLVTAKNIRKGYIDYEKSKEYISVSDYPEIMRRGFPQIGDVLITTEAPCGNVAQVDRANIALAQRVIKYRPKNINMLDPTYLKYILLGAEFQSKLSKAATGGTVKGIKGSKLHKLTIPIPPLSEQARIVSILDRFDTLCNDLTSGLPAEIEARRKQYEYYRDKLLTFPKRNA